MMMVTKKNFHVLRPFSVTLATLILFSVWMWIDMSNAEYRAGHGGERTTAGWFILGFTFVFGLGLLLSLLFCLISRRSVLIGWLCLAGIFIPLIAFAFVNTSPAARLRKALDTDPPADTRIERIQQYDSFGDGVVIFGACSADPDFVQKLINTHAMTPTSAARLQQSMPDERISDDAKAYFGKGLTILHDADRSRLYFFRSWGERRP